MAEDETLPTFEEFHQVATGYLPLPWQEGLALRAAAGDWPRTIGVPTGLGKTSSILVALWALAKQADTPPQERKAPTRLWYVAPRRLLVDSAHELAVEVAELMNEGKDPVMAEMARRLRSLGRLGTDQGALHVVRLRGGTDLGVRSPDPSQPTVVFATVDMFASRWFFRGFGTSRGMRPVDAAHAGIDSLVLLDEAHLAANLQRAAGPLAQCDVGPAAALLPGDRDRSRLVSLTATGDDVDFDLTDKDFECELVQKRLAASKPTVLIETKHSALVKELAETARGRLEALGHPGAAVVFCNTTATARSVCDLLAKLRDTDVRLSTGRMRAPEAERRRKELMGSPFDVRSDRPLTWPSERSLIVVATQTLEVGADLDFDVLVSESAGVRALTQRLGRLNRLGVREDARAAIVHVDDKIDVVYGEEVEQAWNRLIAAADVDGQVQLGPGRIREVLGQPNDEPPRSAELLPAHLWMLAKTSASPVSEPSPQMFYDKVEPDQARVSICWRAWLGDESDGYRLLALPVVDRECVEIPIGEARSFLDALPASSGEPWPWALLDGDRRTLRQGGRLKPGAVVVVAASCGGHDADGWQPLSVAALANPVTDLSIHGLGVSEDGSVRGDRVIPINGVGLEELVRGPGPARASGPLVGTVASRLGVLFDRLLVDIEMTDVEIRRQVDAIAARVEGLSEGVTAVETELQALADALISAEELDVSHILEVLRRGAVERVEGGTPLIRVVGDRMRAEARVRVDAFDDLSFATSVNLTDHVNAVGASAERIACQLGLSDVLVDAVRLAGEFHDLGKADPRFQRLLGATEEVRPIAKSDLSWAHRRKARESSGWPAGGRHEALSGLVITELIDRSDYAWPGDVDIDLIHHLVVSHHGWARPLVPSAGTPEPVEFEVEVKGTPVTVTGDLSQADTAQPARFRRVCASYGYWGVALLESIVRQADHAVSSVARTTEVI